MNSYYVPSLIFVAALKIKYLHFIEEGSEVQGSSMTYPRWSKLLLWNSNLSYPGFKTILTILHYTILSFTCTNGLCIVGTQNNISELYLLYKQKKRMVSLSHTHTHTHTTVTHNQLLELWVFIESLLLFPPSLFKYFCYITVQ